MADISGGVFSCKSISEIVRFIRAISMRRQPVSFGVNKVEGKSFDRLRKEANAKAVDLLNSLTDGAELTDEQRQTLAGYTGEGGIGGSVSEYYTPQPVAEGVWEIMKLYGADVGNTLEPSAGTGVFNETKPVGTVMTATEISTVSGRINKLLHPEDSVQISPFEQLAVSTPNDTFDHVVGNVPFGGRDNTRNIDKPYAEETDMGSYFMLRMLDKIKPGGFMCVIVPPSIVSGTNMKRLRLRLSRKAEFLGAHRLPTGTFDANGTSTVVDVVLMRKHPKEMADRVAQAEESTLEAANVLWPTFITGKWFERDGRRFVHGTQEKGFQGRIEVRADGQIDNLALKAKLIHRFDSRIDWSMLDIDEPSPTADVIDEGEMRLINGVWHKFAGGRWIEADAGKELVIDNERFGADSWEALQRNLSTAEGRLGMTFDQMANVRQQYASSLSDDQVQMVDWIGSQPEKYRTRLYRGAMLGRMLIEYQDMKAAGHNEDDIEQRRLSLAAKVQAEIDRFGNPGRGPIAKLSGAGARAWFAFRGAIKLDGSISDELTGKLVTHDASASYDSTSYQDTLRHLYSDLTRDPVQLEDFRQAFTGDIPASDDELLDLLANTPGIAVSPYGGIVPFARATSGDINEIIAPKQAFLAQLPDGAVRNNVLNQLAAIEEKRLKTPAENIRFKLNSRWFDRSVILEFLQENGYPDLRYVQSVQMEGDEMVSETYHGGDGLFVGHRYGVVQRKDKETGEIRYEWDKKSGDNATGFPAQLEKYLNGARIGGKDSATANGYREQMALLEEQFNKWIKTHDRYDDLVAKYNDIFNSNIPYEHSGDSLGLTGISGKRQPFDYQNSEVRRLSEDGRGILGFGTGLGKTTTGLALEAFNFENGRSTRTAYVVPKSVLENWYYEAKDFLSEQAFSNYLFVGLDVLMDGDQIRQVPVLDENGKPVMNADGTPVMRDGLKLADEATITARMNAIPHSNYRAVVFTKEQYARIPLRNETVDEHAQDMLIDFVAAGRVSSAMESDSHRKEAARRRVLSEYSDTGTEKAEKYPYFEDMGFDSVIADEGHNYRNSYKNGREASQLAYLPTSAVAQSARDMAIKNAYLMKKNGGRGPVMLTATPIVNTPIDAYNMLSHVLPKEFWQKMGIFGPDDFVKFFGKTRLETVQKISGEVEEKMALVGFENLDALRGIFHRWTTLKTAEDVKDTVEIPELDERQQDAPLTDEQLAAYEELRKQAEAAAKANNGMATIEQEDGTTTEEKARPIFSIIRDMDRVCTDMDLYHHRITYRFLPEHADAVQQLADSLPKQATSEDDDSDEAVTQQVQYSLIDKGEFIQLQVPEAFEPEVNKRLAKFGIDERTVTHPVTPKYAKLIATLKEFFTQGKQIIFTDEKTQHQKLKRIICNALNIDPSQVGILNAQTVADAGKSGKKLKAVKPPKDLPDEPTEAQLAKYNEQMALYDAYIAQQNEMSLSGLEKIAADFQEGRTPIIICNKKAEVGINLHRGTTDIHHLTLPWTPASIAQRNGRGARVGSNRASVRVHYYCGKGSFDEYRLKTLKRKAGWISDILRSDKSEMENADANDMIEMQMYTAKDDGERLAMMQVQMDKAKAAQLARQKEQAGVDLQNYVKAQHAAGEDVEALAAQLETSKNELEEVVAEVARYRQLVLAKAAENEEWKARWGSVYSSDRLQLSQYRNSLKAAIRRKADLTSAISQREKLLTRTKKAATDIKRLRPLVEDAMSKGLLSVDPDLINHAKDFLVINDQSWRVGQYYENNGDIVRIKALDFDSQRADVEVIFSSKGTRSSSWPVRLLQQQVDVTPDEAAVMGKISGGVSIAGINDLISRDDFYRFQQRGMLKITDSYAMQNTEHGYSMEFVSSSDTVQNAVYPDRTDGALKSAIAKWALGYLAAGQGYKISSAESFLTELFGSNYRDVISSYGDALSPEDIQERIVAEIAKLPAKSPDGSTRNGDSEVEVANAIFNSYPFRASAYELGTSEFGAISVYSNKAEIKAAMDATNARIAAERQANLDHAVEALAQSWVTAIKGAVATGKITPTIADVVNDGAKFMDAYRNGSMPMPTAYGMTTNHPTYNLVSMFADLVILDLVELSEVTPTLLSARKNYLDVLIRVADGLRARTDEQKAADADRINLALGNITEEEIAARNAQQDEIATVQGDATSTAQALGLNYRVSTADLKMMYAPKFAAGEVFGLQEASGQKGVLFRAKDELKDKFKARWLPAKAKNSDFPGNWWIIETKHNAADVLAVIQQYA
ncbi:N-6 DNA methylase [Salmonella enterica]|nr:N-6 DNA methylase [Salmonella enterica]